MVGELGDLIDGVHRTHRVGGSVLSLLTLVDRRAHPKAAAAHTRRAAAEGMCSDDSCSCGHIRERHETHDDRGPCTTAGTALGEGRVGTRVRTWRTSHTDENHHHHHHASQGKYIPLQRRVAQNLTRIYMAPRRYLLYVRERERMSCRWCLAP